jgi:aminocarboxymuconate-semialdehyde decarboxylase
MVDFDRRLDWMDAQGMRHQIVAPWLDVHGQQLPPADGDDWVRVLNDAMAETVAGSGGRLSAHATLHLGDAEAAARELERATTELGMHGCMLPTHFPEGELHEARYDAVWEAAQSLDVPVVLHPPTESPGAEFFAAKPELKGLFGRTIDTTVVAAMIITSGVFDRFADLRMVLVHGGGLLPFQTGRMDAQLKTPNGTAPSEYLRRFLYDSVLMSPPALRLLFDLAGPEQVMIGSDYAANPKEREAPPLKASLEASGVDAATRAMVVHETAERAFRVGSEPAAHPAAEPEPLGSR